MELIRPVEMDDLSQLLDLAGKAGFGLTSLPGDPEILEKRVKQSVRNFSVDIDEPGGELYMFVMEDTDHAQVVGTSCIVSKVGGFQPFWAYRIENTVHESQELGIRKEIPTLHLVTEHSGPSEIGGLFLSPDHRRRGTGRLLSLFRFLFMQDRPERFERTIIAEMRGRVDENGHSPFWEALGRHFFDMEFPKADYLSVKNKRFIADLMPRCPIYIPLLPDEAAAVIGKVHDDTRPALRMLQKEGFQISGMVDIFEAGPIISCRLEKVRIVRESVTAKVGEISEEIKAEIPMIVTNQADPFRATMSSVAVTGEANVALPTDVASVLGVTIGDSVRYAPLKPGSSNDRDKEKTP